MKTISFLALGLLSASVSFAQQTEDMHSKIESVLKDDAKAYEKSASTKKTDTKVAKKDDAKAEATSAQTATAAKTMELPKYKVQERPFLKESQTTYDAKQKVKAYDKQIAREEANAKETNQDKLLNSKKVSVVGPFSADARSQDAKVRAHELEVKKEVVGTIVDPKDDKENKELMDELNDLEYQKKYR